MAELSRGVKCSRVVLCIINILYFIFGIAILSVGIFILTNRRFNAIQDLYTISESFGDATMECIVSTMILIGVLTACQSLLGCIGAVHEKRTYLYLHSIVLILILVLQCISAVVVIAEENNIYQTYDSGFLEVFHHAYRNSDIKTVEIIENIERELHCCGFNGPDDYTNPYSIPLSCRPYESIVYHPYSQGCARAVVHWTWKHLPLLSGILGGVFLLELFGLICSLIVAIGLSRSKNNSGTYKEI